MIGTVRMARLPLGYRTEMTSRRLIGVDVGRSKIKGALVGVPTMVERQAAQVDRHRAPPEVGGLLSLRARVGAG